MLRNPAIRHRPSTSRLATMRLRPATYSDRLMPPARAAWALFSPRSSSAVMAMATSTTGAEPLAAAPCQVSTASKVPAASGARVSPRLAPRA